MTLPWYRRPPLLATLAAITAVVVFGAVLAFRADDPPLRVNAPVAGPGRADPREEILVGGVRRPASDVRRGGRKPPESRAPEAPNYGVAQPIPEDANPNVASVAEALRTGKYPERLSTLIQPAPFDEDDYEADPKTYLDVVEPGRVWQSAQPGSDIPRLHRLTPRFVEIDQGETISLRARALPGAPVTFTSFDMGAFQNRLTSVTLRADEDGLAVARFTGTPGTLFDVHILAASPVASGQLGFTVTVNPARASGLDAAEEEPPEPGAGS